MIDKITEEVERKILKDIREELKPIDEFKRTSSERLSVIETEIKNIKEIMNEKFKK